MVSPDVASLAAGEIFNDRYCVMYQIAVGGMGAVYACRDLHNHGQFVAVKLVQAHGHDPDSFMVTRFDNEIELTLKVNHPNVVRGLDYFVESGMIGFVTELVQGESIADYLEQYGPVPIDQALEYIRQITEGVKAIHDAGIIHRDLSSENILITKEGEAKIIDFGVAKPTSNARQLTQHGAIVGNLHCVSPEYVADGKLDRRSDLYAIGVLAYMLITGKPPFEGESFIETLSARVMHDPPCASSRIEQCSREVDEFIVRAMARSPKDRFQNAAEMLVDLYALKPEWAELHLLAARQQSRRQMFSQFGSIDDQLAEHGDSEVFAPAVSKNHHAHGFSSSGEFTATRDRSNRAAALAMAFCSIALIAIGFVIVGASLRNSSFANANANIEIAENTTAVKAQAEFITHTVRYRGETLSRIASWYTGDAKNWKELVKANPDLKPERIAIGQTLRLPRQIIKRSDEMPAI